MFATCCWDFQLLIACTTIVHVFVWYIPVGQEETKWICRHQWNCFFGGRETAGCCGRWVALEKSWLVTASPQRTNLKNKTLLCVAEHHVCSHCSDVGAHVVLIPEMTSKLNLVKMKKWKSSHATISWKDYQCVQISILKTKQFVIFETYLSGHSV